MYMTDQELLELFFARSEQAIAESNRVYGPYCHQIAYNILHDGRDAEECVSDTYLTAWNHIPPTRPNSFSAYLGRITRNLSLDRFRRNHAEKRGRGQVGAAVHELDYCIPGGKEPEQQILGQELGAYLNRFVGTLEPMERRVFVRRYWYLDSISEICLVSGFSVAKVKNMLYRTRKKLKAYLVSEGVWDE